MAVPYVSVRAADYSVGTTARHTIDTIQEKEIHMQDSVKVRKVDTQVYVGMLKELVLEGKDVSMLIAGNSMSPFLIHERDRILISPIKEPLRRGDMAFFQRKTGRYVMHRIRSVRKNRQTGQKEYYFIGDNQTETEGPIERDQIFGVITAVQRKGKWLRPGNFWWEFFRHVWLGIIPLRRTIQYLYGCKNRGVQK